MDSDHSDKILGIDSDLDFADPQPVTYSFADKSKLRPRSTTAELPQLSWTSETKSNLQDSFSAQVLEYYKNSAGQEIVSHDLQSQVGLGLGLIATEVTTSLGLGQQAGPELGLEIGIPFNSDDTQRKLLLVELTDSQPWTDVSRPSLNRNLPVSITMSDEMNIASQRQDRPRPMPDSNFPEAGSMGPDKVGLPRERKKWVKPPLFEHTSGSDEAYGVGLFSEPTSIEYEQNFRSKPIDQLTGDKQHCENLTHQTQGLNMHQQTSPNVVLPSSINVNEAAMTEHEGSSESRPKSALDASLDTSGPRAYSPSSSIASNKRGLEWDSGADVGYHYETREGMQVPQISTFERIALARGSVAYRLNSDIKTYLSRNLQQQPAIQETEFSQKWEPSQKAEAKGIKMGLESEDSRPNRPEVPNEIKLYQQVEEHAQTFPPKCMPDLKTIVHNTLSDLVSHKMACGTSRPSSNITSLPTPAQEKKTIETPKEGNFLVKRDSYQVQKSFKEPLAQSTPLGLDFKNNKTKAPVESKKRQAEEARSSYFSISHSATDISVIPQQGETIEKNSNLRQSSSREEQIYRKENISSMPSDAKPQPHESTAQKASEKFSHKLVQTSYFPPLQSIGVQAEIVSGSKENAQSSNPENHTSSEKATRVFCVEEIEVLIKNIQRKANEHQALIDNCVKQTNSQQTIPNTFPRTYRDENLSRVPLTHKWAQSNDVIDRGDPVTNKPTARTGACSTECRGAHNKRRNRSESTNSVSPCISPHVNEEGSCYSMSSCYFSDTPRSGNIANERGTVGSAGSFEYLPGHVYEKTNIKNIHVEPKVGLPVAKKSGLDFQNRKPSSLEEDLKVWAQLCEGDVIKTKDVVNQIVGTNYVDDEEDEDKDDKSLQNQHSQRGSMHSDNPSSVERSSTERLLPKRCDKSTQIETIFSTASSDVESNTSSRRPSSDKNEDSSERTCGKTEISLPRSCKHGEVESTSSPTFSSAGYNTSTSHSFTNCEAGDWQKPATQSEQEFESRHVANKKYKSKHTGTKKERLAIIDEKINHLTNLKMILERQDKLKKSLRMDNENIGSAPVPKFRTVCTVMTATVDRKSEENDENETAVKELYAPVGDVLPLETVGPLEGQSDLVENWSSHHHLISRNTREIATQIPSCVTLNVHKEPVTGDGSSKHSNQDVVVNKIVETTREIYTQTPSNLDLAESSHSVDLRKNQGKINVCVQTTLKDSENKENSVQINVPNLLCCCQCEENLSILKEKANIGHAKQSTSIESCPESCHCKCHHNRKHNSLITNGHRINVPVSLNKPHESRKKNKVAVTCNCEKLYYSTPVCSSSASNGSTHHHQHCAILNDTRSKQIHYQSPVRPLPDFVATPKTLIESSRNATRNMSTSTVDNKGVQTSDSVNQLPIIRPLWFSTSNSHVKIRSKKCVCCSRQPVKTISQDSTIFEENSLLQKTPTFKSSSHFEGGRCPQNTNSYKSSNHVEDVILRCQKCQRDIKICHCKFVKTSTSTGTSEESWDISALSGTSTQSKSENQNSALTPRSIGYLLTFETASGSQSSSSETARKRSLQEVKVKIPAARSTSGYKNHTHHKKERTKLKTTDTLPQEVSIEEVRVQIPSRKSSIRHEEKPTQILNSNRRADIVEEAKSKSDSLEEVTVKLPPEKKNHHRSHRSRPTLQDYLRSARPDYIKMAEARRRCLAELADLRLLRHENRQRLLALASQPGSVIDTDTISSANSMLPPPPMALKRVFNQKTMRKHTEKGYQKCPEVVNKKVDKKRKEDYRTNRLMAEIFTKKLQKKALRGDVNLSNSVSVISIL